MRYDFTLVGVEPEVYWQGSIDGQLVDRSGPYIFESEAREDAEQWCKDSEWLDRVEPLDE